MLGGNVIEQWHPYQFESTSNGQQLAGYTVGYENLRYTTVKGKKILRIFELLLLNVFRSTKQELDIW